jgi:circadian clock protein KaiC
MTAARKHTPVEKIATGISSFDIIAKGGLPRNRTTLIPGTAGSGKTIFAVQFLAAGIEAGTHAVFVTFEESASDIRKNMLSFGWDLEKWEAEGKLAFVDASPDPMIESVEVGGFDLGALLARVQHAVRKVKAERVAVDSLGAVFSQFSDQSIVRSELFRIASALKAMSVTAVLTAERTDDYGPIARFGVEEFIADNVMILRNVLEDESRRRTIEILKFRGCDHQKGEYPFTIVPDGGVIVIPLSAMHLSMKSSNIRISSGNAQLDEMCGGGLFRDSVTLVSGATGTGKTLTVTQFLQGGASNGERCLLLAFEESRDQLVRNATGWGFDFGQMERNGQLRVVCDYPDVSGLEDWLVTIQAAIREFTIDKGGMRMGRAFRNVTGILAGAPVHVSPGDLERAWTDAETDSVKPRKQ